MPRCHQIRPAAPLAVALACVVAVLAGCNKPERPRPKGPGVTAEAKTKTVAEVPKVAATADDSLLSEEQRKIVLADLGGGHTITLGDLEARLNRESQVVRQQYSTIAKRKEYLVNWVQFEILADEARKQGLAEHPDVVAALKQQMVRRFLKEAVIDAIKIEDIKDAEIEAYYKNNLVMYQRPAQVEVRHILLKTEEQAKRVLNEIRAGSQGNSAQIAGLWKDYVTRLTEDKATIPYLGSIGRVSKTIPEHLSHAEKARLNAIPKAVVDAAFLTEPYKLSGVIKSDKGFHILLPVSKLPAVDKKLDAVKESIRRRLLKRKRDLKRKEMIRSLRTSAKVKINDDAVRQLPARPAAPKPLPKKAAPVGGKPAGKAK